MRRNELTGAEIAAAAAGYIEARMRELPAPEACEHEYPAGFYASLLDRLKKRQRRRQLLRQTVAAVLALFLCGGIFLSVRTDARASFFAWVRGGGSGPALDELPETDSLVIWVPKFRESAERRTAGLYTARFGVKVEVVGVDGDTDAYRERVLRDLAAGTGPDVLYLNDMDLDPAKAVRDDLLLDLTDLLAGDRDFREDDYLNGAFASGRYGGRQYAVPLSVNPSFALALPDVLEELGFRRDRIGSTSDFLEELARVTPRAAEQPYFEQMMSSKNRFHLFLSLSGIPLIDYETGTVLPDERVLGEFLRAYKAYFPYDYDEGGDMTTYGNAAAVLTTRICCFCLLYQPAALTRTIRSLKGHDAGYEAVPLPGQSGGTVGDVVQYAAVSADAGNKRNAYNYIKMLLSEELQEDEQAIYCLPVRKDAIRAGLSEGLYDPNFASGANTGSPKSRLSEAELDALYETVVGIDRCAPQITRGLAQLVFDAMLPWFRDECGCGDCLDTLREELTRYLNE